MEQILVVLFLIFLLWFAISAKKIFGGINQKGKTHKETSFISQKLFTPAERSFFGVIDNAIDGEYRVMGKVRLADLITTRKGMNASERQKALNKITGKHVDFVVCRSSDLVPVVAIELDDQSHANPKRMQRDKFIEQALSSAGIPLVRYKALRQYNRATVMNKLTPFLTDLEPNMPGENSENDKSTTSIDNCNQDQNQLVCPRCGSQLVKRIAKKGSNKGAEFYGCTAYPKCRYVRQLNNN